MKKVITLIAIICVFSLATLAYADTPLRKLGRGAANIITCPLEIPKGISDANAESGFIAAFTFGVIKGIFNTGMRGIVGAYEVVSFLIPIPQDYGPILTNPEFFFEDSML